MPSSPSCRQCAKPFDVLPEDLAFLEKLSPVIGGKKQLIAPPTLCPECRQQRRCAQGNQMYLYKRPCSFTGEMVVSNYYPEAPYPVYKQEVWYSDQWDATSYGRDIDFNRPFFEQYAELLQVVPRYALHTTYQYDENSEYVNYCTKNKNCYLIFDSDLNRDCYYSYSINTSESCVDCFRAGKSELCYECVDCQQCYGSAWLQDCENCSGSMFLKNCIGCKNCLMCSNLRNKEYYVENKKVDKQTFEKIRAMLTSRTAIKGARERFEKLKLEYPQKYMHGTQNENVLGDYLTQCKNAWQCFDSRNLWDCRRNYQGWMATKDSMDTQEVGDCQLMYESAFSGSACEKFAFCTHCFYGSDLFYCNFCMHCKNCFGCVSMNRKEYCILNKQYTKDEYEKLVPKLIEHMRKTGEWGELTPVSMASFAYNESLAQHYFPLTPEEARKRGWQWREEDPKAKLPPTAAAPDAIDQVQETITHEMLACETCRKNYRIIPQELAFYKQNRLPVPARCFDCRHKDRSNQRNPRVLYDRECDNCSKKIETTYAPDRPEKIFCEECYNQSVA